MKKLLVISATFYPHKAVGAIRVTQWCKHLSQFGWETKVLTQDYGQSVSPEDFENELGSSTTLEYLNDNPLTGNSPSHRGLKHLKKKLANWLASKFLVPDPSILRWKKFHDKILKLADAYAPDAVLTTSPPHAVHSAGLFLKTERNIPWVCDFRDPYLMDHRTRPTGVAALFRERFKTFEKEVTDKCDLCVCAIPEHADYLKQSYPNLAVKFKTLTNGFPSEMSFSSARSSGTYRIVTAGFISDESVVFFKDLVERLNNEVQFIHVGRTPVSANGFRHPQMEFRGRVAHHEAVQVIANSDLLVVFSSKQRAESMALSSKLFEYIATGKPILLIRPTRPDSNFAGGMDWIKVMNEPDLDDAEKFVKSCRKDTTHAPLEWLERFRVLYNRKSQTETLSKWLHQIPTT